MYLRTKCTEKQFFAKQHQGHCILKRWDVFFSTSLPLPLLDLRVHPEGLGTVGDKKLLNASCLDD